MRKIIASFMITLDGVMQAPGSPEEDPSGGFSLGGWAAPYGDEVSGRVFQEKLMPPSDLLLGRKTFEIWENYWPQHEKGWPGINAVTKYVLSATRESSHWSHSVFLKSLADIKKLKASDGGSLRVWGSSGLGKLLFQNDLVDELWLITYPVLLGRGKKLFADGAIPAAFTLGESTVTPKGVLIAHYLRSGEVLTGRMGP